MKSRELWFLCAAITILAFVWIDPCGIRGSSKPNEKSAIQVRTPIVKTTAVILPTLDLEEQYYAEQEREVNAYLTAVTIDTYLSALTETQREVDAYLYAITPKPQPVVRSVQSTPVQTGSGDCSGVAAIVGWGTVNHESGGDPMAQNGIYKGCAQISTGWWNGACSGLNWTNVQDQATCAQIVMNLQGPSAWAGTYSR